MRTSFVIDASVIISWRDPRPQESYGQNILTLMNRESAIVPVICCMEVNNVLRQFEKRGLITRETTLETIELISGLPISVDEAPVNFRMPRVEALARRYDLTIYDACYLELAARLALPLATMDSKLIAALKNAGLALKTA
ncbi:MAG: type II toxin-antitoxin system VapC family toxin [Synergistaceae bacterium]|jgi:predicted nucleic acid-binding protein|nr:type II toxin-antitoxin system VapC family toxin [Synergistaceae bacterium]